MTDLYTLISSDVALKKTAGTHGGEYHGPCPFCGGRDRLAVWPNAERPGWWCRMCEKGGDAIQYLREKGHTFRDACALLGVVTEHPAIERRSFAPPVSCEAPPQAWRSAASAFVFWSQAELEKTPPTWEYLCGRGLTDKTIRAAGLGYNPTGRWSERAKWGLPADNEGNTHIWLPAGVVIPCYVGGTLWKVQVRREVVNDGQDRYKTITGSANALYGADSLTAGKPAMLVEGPFDCLAVRQAASDLIGVAACGTSGARRARWLTKLALCTEVLVSLDADAAGDSASAWWLDIVGGSKRWRPYYADPAQMLEDGQDVRGWVLAGLGMVEPPALSLSGLPLDYWRGEVAQNSPALDRLQKICQERGADYDKTIASLR